jgi:heme-degrading monooxygenase HmoA
MVATTTRITFFRVPAADDDAFVAAWERARDGPPTALHRALRADVDFRFVEVAPGSHPAFYEVAHEDGVPDGVEGVVLIEAFEVPAAAHDEAFLAGWREAHTALAAQPGYVGARLHRAAADADFRFVEIARWSSPLAFSKAVRRPDVRALTGALPFAAHPALYLVVGR